MALRVFGPRQKFYDLGLPLMPPNVEMEMDHEALGQIGLDLSLLKNQQFYAVDLYRRFGFNDEDSPFWGYLCCIGL